MDRRRLLSLCLPLACLLLPAAARAAPAPELSENDVQVFYENDMYVGRFSFVVPVPTALAWEVLTDFDHMATFVPYLEVSRVAVREGNTLLVAQRGKIDLGPFSIPFSSERRVEMHPLAGRLLSRGVAGNTEHLLSEMRLLPDAQGTRLDYRVEMIPDRWLPSSLGVGFMRRQLASQFTALAREMAHRWRRRQPSA